MLEKKKEKVFIPPEGIVPKQAITTIIARGQNTSHKVVTTRIVSPASPAAETAVRLLYKAHYYRWWCGHHLLERSQQNGWK